MKEIKIKEIKVKEIKVKEIKVKETKKKIKGENIQLNFKVIKEKNEEVIKENNEEVIKENNEEEIKENNEEEIKENNEEVIKENNEEETEEYIPSPSVISVSIQHDECIEFKNLQYKTMMQTGNLMTLKDQAPSSKQSISNMQNYLENEMNQNKLQSWCKLNKTIQLEKLLLFIETFQKEKHLTEEEKNILIIFFKECLDKKKLQRVKDVIYDIKIGIIKEVPSLFYNRGNKHFTLKNLEKRISTLKLPPNKNK